MSSGPAIVGVLGLLFLILALSFVVFMILRALMLWYWRINETVALLQSIDKKLGAIADSGIQISTEPREKEVPDVR